MENPKIDMVFILRLKNFLSMCRVELSCDSWFRTKARNLKDGGASHSWHLNGQAIDLIADSISDLIMAAEDAEAFGWLGIECDLRDNHLHLDNRTIPWKVGYLHSGEQVSLAGIFNLTKEEVPHEEGSTSAAA